MRALPVICVIKDAGCCAVCMTCIIRDTGRVGPVTRGVVSVKTLAKTVVGCGATSMCRDTGGA